ncbi:MAG: hypothetical protein PHF00_10180 [Elusimicrobia bacterium]|nr:hypothetical protein [Elusimicrobiota bacterium]
MPPRFPRVALWTAAVLVGLPALFFPLFNPDLFWHLSAGRWMIERHRLPRADFLSFSAGGLPWTDFEWLSQLVFAAVHAAAGMAGLWLLKALALAGSWLWLDGMLARRGLTPAPRAAALAAWSAVLLPYSDIRPELFSLLLFMWLIRRLECAGPPSWLASFGLFALWANLHGGFAAGLGLLACCAAAALARRRGAEFRRLLAALAAGLAGTAANPYFLQPHLVAWRHWLMRADLAATIAEWQPMSWSRPMHWPFYPMFLLLALLTAAAWRRRAAAAPWGLAAAALLLGAGAAGHQRGALYFGAAAVPAAFLLLRELGWQNARGLAPGIVALSAAFVLWLAPRVEWRLPFNYRFAPTGAARFLARERKVMEPLRLYNQWEWGGYLGWTLAPWYRVFCDGRYIFHEQLAQSGQAVRSPERWRAFMAEHGLDGSLMLNLDRPFPARKRYPDGSTKPFPRPWYVFYMPKPRWALVYWDELALLFVDRGAVPADWLKAHEYRYVRPKDDAAFQEALRLKEIPAAAAEAEAERHRRELDSRD